MTSAARLIVCPLDEIVPILQRGRLLEVFGLADRKRLLTRAAVKIAKSDRLICPSGGARRMRRGYPQRNRLVVLMLVI